MPSPAHVAWARLRVATMIGGALGILSVLVYLLLGGAEILEPSVSVHAYMIDLAGLKKGSPVEFNGIRVGTVTAAELSGLMEPQKVVRIDMEIKNAFLKSIPEDSTVVVSAETVLGDKFADINEGKSSEHLRAGAELASPPAKEISNADLIKAAHDILAQMDTLLTDIEAGRGNLGQFVKGEEFYRGSLHKVTEFQKQIRAATSPDTPAGRLLYDQSLYEKLRAPVKRLDQALADLQAARTVAGTVLAGSAQYDRLRESVSRLKRALVDLNAGKGSAGQMVQDDSLYQGFLATLDRLNAQVDALNSADGTLGQLMVNSSVYENLQLETRNLQSVLREVRENPEKFLYLKLF